MPMSDDIKIISEPEIVVAGPDPVGILQELSEVLRKHGCVLQAQGAPFVLAKVVDRSRLKCVAICQVETIAPEFITARISGRPQFTKVHE